MRTAGLATMAYYYFDFRDFEKQDRYNLLSSCFPAISRIGFLLSSPLLVIFEPCWWNAKADY